MIERARAADRRKLLIKEYNQMHDKGMRQYAPWPRLASRVASFIPGPRTWPDRFL